MSRMESFGRTCYTLVATSDRRISSLCAGITHRISRLTAPLHEFEAGRTEIRHSTFDNESTNVLPLVFERSSKFEARILLFAQHWGPSTFATFFADILLFVGVSAPVPLIKNDLSSSGIFIFANWINDGESHIKGILVCTLAAQNSCPADGRCVFVRPQDSGLFRIAVNRRSIGETTLWALHLATQQWQ